MKDITLITRLRVTLRYDRVSFPVIPAEFRIPSLRTGSAQPYLVVNRILICSGGLGLPHQQGWGSCSGVLSTLFTGATVFATRTKR